MSHSNDAQTAVSNPTAIAEERHGSLGVIFRPATPLIQNGVSEILPGVQVTEFEATLPLEIYSELFGHRP
jgi:hypothetical protein